MIPCDAPHEMHPYFAKSPNSLKSIRLLTSLSDLNLLGALYVGNDLLWHPNAFGPIVGLLVHLDSHHLVISLLLQEIRCGGLLSTLLV